MILTVTATSRSFTFAIDVLPNMTITEIDAAARKQAEQCFVEACRGGRVPIDVEIHLATDPMMED